MMRRLVPAAILTAMMAAVLPSSSPRAGVIQTDPTKRNREWIAIVPAYWAPRVTPLRDYRLSQGRPACIWTFDDLLDSYGDFGPSGIRMALQEAWNTWTVKPRWVCIFADHRIGESSNYLASRIGDLGIPNQELGLWEPYIRGLLPLMDVTGDSLPDIAVGRVPASSDWMVANYVSKVIQHDSDVNGRIKYRNSVMLVEDQNVAGNDSLWVRHLGDSLYANWDVSPNRQLLHYSDFPCCLAPQRQAAIAAWDAGPGMVVAMGNGSNWFELVGFWETCATVNSFNVSALSANGSYPALLALSCAVNATDQPVVSSCDQQGILPLSEQLLCQANDKGASVVIAPMRNSIQYWDFFIGKHLLLRKAANDYTWGELLAHAMRDALEEDPTSYDHVYQYTLEGDPAAQANPGDVVAVGPPTLPPADLRAPYPSPAALGAQIQYDLDRRAHVELAVCDVAGRRVRVLQAGEASLGHYTQSWDLATDGGERVRPGIYFIRLRVGDAAYRRRLVVVR
ncbi:MAG: T9SS type A sorting domain-containing protein [Candidatus Eisenbacteria bacterium]|nr:T9SS type A sorting domain-containing protein [Candidatus Eisenbacteria bacterium]